PPTRQFPPNPSILARLLLYFFTQTLSGLTCNPVAPASIAGGTETVQREIIASEWCGALRKNKQ
ncbi:hypothetical protein, partial [uncultured Enterobacter sp.]|uniref:hypothetical protein n=1 Tax=uncultured Enterobacter sp. TaxID=238202 RepID=UPI002594D3A4